MYLKKIIEFFCFLLIYVQYCSFLCCFPSLMKVEHCWQEYKYNEANASTLFREKLMEELKAPYCEEEYKRLLHDITIQKPIQHHRDLRGGIKIYEKPDLGKSFLGYHVGKY